jgi:hypothetical protein
LDKQANESSSLEAVQAKRDEYLQLLRQEREVSRELRQQLTQAQKDTKHAQLRTQYLERVLRDTRRAAQIQRAQNAKEAKVILFGTVKPENDPQLHKSERGEDSLLRRGLRSLRTRGVAGTLRKLKEFRKRK